MIANLYGTTRPGVVRSLYDFSQDDGRGGAGGTQSSPAATPPAATTPSVVSKGSSSSSTPVTTSSTSPYAQFRGNNYEKLEKFLLEQMQAIKPETAEEREERERREKRTGFLARLADGLGSFHTAFSHARGEKAMDMPNVSERVRALYEKAKSQRDKENDRLVNYALALANIKDKDREFNFHVTQAEQQQSNWQQQYDAGRQDRADDVAFRDKEFDTKKSQWREEFDTRNEQWQKKFDSDNDHWQQGFDENQRQFNETHEENVRHNKRSENLQGQQIAETRRHNQASERLEGQRIAASQDGRYMDFSLGDGSFIRVDSSKLNPSNISYVFSKTPSAGRPSGGYNANGQYTSVSSDQMLQWIGQNLDNQQVQSALRRIVGFKQNNKGPAY